MHVLLLSDCNKEKLIVVSIMVNPCKKLDINLYFKFNYAAIARDGHALMLYTTDLEPMKWHYFHKNMHGLPVVVTVLFCHNLLVLCHYLHQAVIIIVIININTIIITFIMINSFYFHTCCYHYFVHLHEFLFCS